MERSPRTVLHVIDPDEFLGNGDWKGEVPEEEADPTMEFALDKLREVLPKPGVVIITDAGPNRGQREAILRLVKHIRPLAEVHSVLVETAPLVAMGRNWTRKRTIPHEIWRRVHLEYKQTFYRMVKSGAYPRWEVYDADPTWYEDLLDKYYRCSYITPSGEQYRYQFIGFTQEYKENVLPLFVMGMGEQWSMVKRKIYCHEHHPCSHVSAFGQKCCSFAHSKLVRCGQFCGNCKDHCPHMRKRIII
ncbi:nitrous oxide-stimulated promoter family protein [Shimazuella alba]|uniref:Uncharacterized protein n=1 Tax=Shimazuella alba TaxID=2690964 RepID=A0A6I4W4W8_9BACL|nr:nitrous oxide-stimulated promoter family protein [Shimazuella alba]MXQ55814.1 hypothetical protein [Shimazuella alba]